MITKEKIKLLIVAFSMAFAATAQHTDDKMVPVKNNTLKKVKMKKLATKEFNLIKNNKNNKVEFSDQDSVYELVDEEDNIKRVAKRKGENFTKTELYNRKSLLRTSDGTFFLGMPIGEHHQYDSKGNVRKSKNYDEDYKLSMNDYIDLIKRKIGLDLHTITYKESHFSRGFDADLKIHFYYLMYKVEKYYMRIIKVNADTGDIYYDVKKPILG